MPAELFTIPFQCVVVTGLAVPGATLTFYQSGTTTKLPIFTTANLTTPRTNPVVANNAGHIPDTYLDDTQVYRLVIKNRGGTVLEDIDPYIPGVTTLGITLTSATGQSVNSRGALAALSPTVNDQVAFLTEAGREGMFVFSTLDLSAEVAADLPHQGVYVAPASDTDGSSGAWVRRFLGPVNAEWFGAVGNGIVDDSAEIQAAIDYQVAQTGGEVRLPVGRFLCGTMLEWEDAPVVLVGSGSSVQPDVGTTLYFPNSATQTGAVNPRNGPDGKGAGSGLFNIRLSGDGGAPVSDANAKLGLGAGLLVQANSFRWDNVVIDDFEGNGFYILSAYPSADVTINANNCRGGIVHCYNNLKNGFATYGVDSNNGEFGLVDCGSNGQFGIYENSFLGNTYHDAHCAGNDGAVRLGNVTRANRITLYKEVSEALVVQMDAGGGGRNVLDLRQVEGDGGGTVTITDNTGTGDNYWFSSGVWNKMSVGAGNSNVGMFLANENGAQVRKGAAFAALNAAEDKAWSWSVNSDGTLVFSGPAGEAINTSGAGIVTGPVELTGDIDITTGVININGVQVLRAQMPAIGDHATDAKVNEILATLRTIGLIDT